MSNLFSIEGKTALVTGGSRGIGEMIVRGFVDAGVKVYISSRKADVCEALAEELRDAGGDVTALPADLSTEDACAALGGELESRERSLDILVNNAGATWGAPLEEFDEAAWERVLALNVKGVFFTTRYLLPLLEAASKPDEPSRVINIGSIDGLRAPPTENYSYSASKAAVHMLTRHLAKRLASEHITVNAIAPGPFYSRMMAWALDDPESREIIEQMVPLGRVGSPDDVAGLTLFLSSRAGAYLTGTVIPLDGGITGCN
jgi:NAD(P)-dependent dehydrogenase (short-subunit alcohol dehydrogenase family)